MPAHEFELAITTINEDRKRKVYNSETMQKVKEIKEFFEVDSFKTKVKQQLMGYLEDRQQAAKNKWSGTSFKKNFYSISFVNQFSQTQGEPIANDSPYAAEKKQFEPYFELRSLTSFGNDTELNKRKELHLVFNKLAEVKDYASAESFSEWLETEYNKSSDKSDHLPQRILKCSEVAKKEIKDIRTRLLNAELLQKIPEDMNDKLNEQYYEICDYARTGLAGLIQSHSEIDEIRGWYTTYRNKRQEMMMALRLYEEKGQSDLILKKEQLTQSDYRPKMDDTFFSGASSVVEEESKNKQVEDRYIFTEKGNAVLTDLNKAKSKLKQLASNKHFFNNVFLNLEDPQQLSIFDFPEEVALNILEKIDRDSYEKFVSDVKGKYAAMPLPGVQESNMKLELN